MRTGSPALRPILAGVVLLLALVGAPLGARATAPAPTQPASGGTLVVGVPTLPATLDPARTISAVTNNVLALMTDTLFDLRADGSVTGRLVETFEQPSPTTYLWKLRPGITFHDGTAFDAEAVRFNLQRQIDDTRAVRRRDLQRIVAIDTPDPLTVRVELSEPYAPFLHKLTTSAGVMLSPAAIAGLGDRLPRDLAGAGTGPFMFVRLEQGNVLVTERNPHYWQRDAAGRPLPYLDGIIYKVLRDAEEQARALRAGRVDMLAGVSAGFDLDEALRDPSLSAEIVPTLDFGMITLNTRRAPFDQPAVRRALSLALDRGRLAGAQASFRTPHDTPLPAALSWAIDEGEHPYLTTDVAAARAELARAGLADGFTFTLQMATGYRTSAIPGIIRDSFAAVGVTVRIQFIDFSYIVQNTESGTYEAAELSWVDDPDPDDHLYRLVRTGADSNYGGYSNPRVDSLLDAARDTFDGAARAELYKEAQRILYEEQPLLVHSSFFQTIVTRRVARGITVPGNGFYAPRGLESAWLTEPLTATRVLGALSPLKSYRFAVSLSAEVSTRGRGTPGSFTLKNTGEVVAPDRYHGVCVEQEDQRATTEEAIVIGRDAWVKDSSTRGRFVMREPDLCGTDAGPADLFTDLDFSAFTDTEGIPESVNGVAALHYHLDATTEAGRDTLARLFGENTLPAGVLDQASTIEADLWLARDGGWPARFTLSLSADGADEGMSFTLTITVDIADANSPDIVINPP